MKVVYLNDDNTVREILPEATYEQGAAFWYGEEFASHCIEAPDGVEQNWVYNPETGAWSEPVPFEPEPIPEPEVEPDVWDELAEAYKQGVQSAYDE